MRYAIALTAALTALAFSVPANAQSQSVQSGKYCLTTKDAGLASANCSFQTMAACDKSKTGKNDQCMPNSTTTGAGSGMKDNTKKQ